MKLQLDNFLTICKKFVIFISITHCRLSGSVAICGIQDHRFDAAAVAFFSFSDKNRRGMQFSYFSFFIILN